MAEFNHCDHGHVTIGEVRLLPTSEGKMHGNMIVCEHHYLAEIKYRAYYGGTLFPKWEDLKIYEEGGE